jgi:hypothetical protein
VQAAGGIEAQVQVQVQDVVIAQVRTAVEVDAQRTLAVGIQKEVETFQGAGTAGVAFHCEDRFAATHNDEIDFPSGGVAKEAKTHGFNFGVLVVVAVFQELGCEPIFEAGGGIVTERPIPHVELLFLFRRPQLGQAVWWDPESRVLFRLKSKMSRPEYEWALNSTSRESHPAKRPG